MCTVVTLFRPGHTVPLHLAANRDELLARAWDPPAAYWPDQPDVVAGRDRSGGGTWMGINRRRRGRRGPEPRRQPGAGAWQAQPWRAAAAGAAPCQRRRCGTGNDASGCRAMAQLQPGGGRSRRRDLPARAGARTVAAQALAPGLHMVTAHDPDDLASPRVSKHLPRLRAAPPPDEDGGAAWRAILSDDAGEAGEQINVTPRGGFGTVCASLVALRG